MLRTNLIGVADTTLGRYFARAEVKKQLGRAGRQLRAEEHALAAPPLRRAAARTDGTPVKPQSRPRPNANKAPPEESVVFPPKRDSMLS
jgi:hypothetical protein